jgi:hypothetical protein
MRLMILTLASAVMWGCTGTGAAGAVAAESAAAEQELHADAPVDHLLDALHRRGEDLRDFQADVSLTEESPDLGIAGTRHGRVWYQDRPDDQPRIRVTFDRKQDRGVMIEERIEYLLEERWLVERDYRRRTEVNRQVLRPGERVDLLKLGEGPFPLPIGQPKEEVKRMFEVEKLPVSPGDPEGTTKVRLSPRPGTQFERNFNTIDVSIDLQNHMPVRIETVDPNQASIRTTDLSNIQVNVGLGDEQFRLPPIDERQWDRHDVPFEQ